MKRIDLIIAAAALTASASCGPQTTEPMPDIPQTVEYDTVRIEYGDDDLLETTPEGQRMQALVGDPSRLADFTRQVIKGTNDSIYRQIDLVDSIQNFPPTHYREETQTWSWDNAQFKQPDENFARFEITKVDEETIDYELRSGTQRDDLLLVFNGRFTNRTLGDGPQRGFGILRADLDNLKQVDPDANTNGGKVAIAFRAIGGVRQVRVGFYQFEQIGEEPLNAIYDYTQLPNGAGRFKWFARLDFEKDGRPYEFVGIDTAWTTDRAGKAAARISGGSLEVNEVLLNECWDSSSKIVWADAEPDLPNYDDGDPSACAEALSPLQVDAPQYQDPDDREPDVPGPHPEES